MGGGHPGWSLREPDHRKSKPWFTTNLECEECHISLQSQSCSKAAKPHDTRKEEEKRAAHSQYWSNYLKILICWIQFLSISTAKLLLEPRISTLTKDSCGEHRAMNMWKSGCLAYYYFCMQKLRFLSCLRAKVRHKKGANGHQWFCYLCVLWPWCIKIPKVQNNLWHASSRTQRMIHQFGDFLVEYPVCVISVPVVWRCKNILVFFMLSIYRTVFQIQ